MLVNRSGEGMSWNQALICLAAIVTGGLVAAAGYRFTRVKAIPAYRHAPARNRARRRAVAGPRQTAASVVDGTAVQAWVCEAARMVEDKTQYLTHLDAVIGDADHGTNMRRGFRAAVAMLAESSPATPAAVLAATGRAFIANLGGASGPLYGTGFRQAAQALGDAEDISAIDLGHALRAALAGIQDLGAAIVGDKTMVDAWDPAVRAYEAIINTGGDIVQATRAAADGAERGLRATVAMQARKGRASYLGARTVGHEDPGAASTVLILCALATTIAARTSVLPA
jgi:phosphoenolpyruvate---glycerone phosphotransferase subunit DhaL